MKNALTILNTAEKHGVTIDGDLVALVEAARTVSIPSPSYADLVAQTVDAMGTKDFDKVAARSLDALARNNTTFVNDVRKAASAKVEREFASRLGDIFSAFEPTLSKHVETLNLRARDLPAHTNKMRVMDAPIDVIVAWREVEHAWSVIEDVAAALKPLYSGRGDHGARFAPLLVTRVPQQFESLAQAVEFKNALDGKWRGMSGAYTTVESDVDIHPAPALASFGVTFEVASPEDFPERVTALDDALRPKTYRDPSDTAGIFEQSDAPRALVL